MGKSAKQKVGTSWNDLRTSSIPNAIQYKRAQAILIGGKSDQDLSFLVGGTGEEADRPHTKGRLSAYPIPRTL